MVWPILQYALTHSALVAAPIVVETLQAYLHSIKKNAKMKKPFTSVKLAAVAIVDDFSSVWSPQDVLAYCSILSANTQRAKAGTVQLGT